MHPNEFFITEDRLPNNQQIIAIEILSAPAFKEFFMQSHAFSAKFGEKLYLFEKNGILKKIILDSGNKKIKHVLAEIVNSLPSGVYQLHSSLGYQDALYWGMAQYKFNKYKENKNTPKQLIVSEELIEDLVTELSVIFKVRDLINEPANIMTPATLANEVKELTVRFSANFQEFVGDELLAQNFPAIYTVGKAACEAPRLAMLSWGEAHHPLLAIVGKGVCFDSGGLDLKSSQSMRLMKKDMGGAANAIGLAYWIMEKKLPFRIMLLIPSVENAISADAYRPGDIIKMRNGLFVEIDNTDAEGRLILADCLTYAAEHSPDWIIDLSTLTGAARIAVGTEIAAFFTHDNTISQQLVQIANNIDDYMWPLPLFSGYSDLLHSSIADCVNSASSSYAGAITAALFLEKFVPSTIKWLHVDCMAWNVNNKAGKPEGGEAMAIRAIFNYLLMFT